MKQPQLASEKKRETDFPHTLRERDLENHLGNDTLKNQDLEMDKKQKGEISVGGPVPKEPKINETPESPAEPAQLKDEDDYQLQRAEDLLKGLAILDKMPGKKK